MSPQAGPPPTERNKLNTLFVGAIPSGVTDEWIEHLLKVIKLHKQSLAALTLSLLSLVVWGATGVETCERSGRQP
jgi:hypothetical protein